MIKWLGLFILSVLTLAVAAKRGFAQTPEFTTASLKGICGFTQAANVDTPPHFLPRPALGTLTFNGAGAVTLTATSNNAGTVSSGTQSGSYSWLIPTGAPERSI